MLHPPLTASVEMADNEVLQEFQVDSEEQMKLIFDKFKVDLEDWRRQLEHQDDIFTSSSSRNLFFIKCPKKSSETNLMHHSKNFVLKSSSLS